jgi:hypothetical protein
LKKGSLFIQSSLRDSTFIFASIPSNKLLGYFHKPLTGLNPIILGHYLLFT